MNRQLAIELIKQYINSWKQQNLSLCLSTLSSDVVIAECYGPVYNGIDQVHQWFINWHASPKEGKITKWEITNVIFDETKSMAAVEWDFEYTYEKKPGAFYGFSLFYFNDSKIIRIHEYQMNKNQYNPYE